MERYIRYGIMVFGVIAAIITSLLPLGIDPQAQLVLASTILVMVFWFAEVVPLHVSGLIGAFLLIVWAGFTPTEVFAPFFDPVLVLLLGGFVLAVAMQKHKLDEVITLTLLSRVGHSPKKFLLVLMALTAFVSFWMTNTASTAVILPIALVVLAANKLEPLKSNYGKAIVLGIAYAATIGGLGTLIGSTPNAMALKFLGDQGIQLTFLDWMFYGVPIVIIMVPVAWIVLYKMYRPEIDSIEAHFERKPLSKEQKIIFAIFFVTVALWLTTGFHGISASTISLVPIILLYLFGLLNTKDFSRVQWAALILFGAGLSIGTAMHASGLDQQIANLLLAIVFGQPMFLVLLIILLFAILLTIVASNTAAGAIMIPVILPLAPVIGIDPKILAILVAVGVSLDFIVPVGTPPSTIAYSSGYIKTKDMAKSGIVVAAIGTLVVALLAYFVWGLF